MKRPEPWHDAYKAIFGEYKTIQLNLQQAARVTGLPVKGEKNVSATYPHGWSREKRNKVIRLDCLLDQVFGLY